MAHEQQERHLAALVQQAKAGDRQALEQLARAIKDRIYGLSLRMLGDPAESEDAAQEILVKVITRLDSFRGDSKFSTWVYAVAANHLRTMRKRGWERNEPTFDGLREHLGRSVDAEVPPSSEHAALAREVRLICLHVLLICLDRDHRLAYVLGEHLELDGAEGAKVLGIRPAAFRKRLSRARQRLHGYMHEKCALVRADAPCRCEMRIEYELARGFDPRRQGFSDLPRIFPDGFDAADLEGLDELCRIDALYKAMPVYRAPQSLVDGLANLLDAAPDRPAES